jgi:hypothetical protein
MLTKTDPATEIPGREIQSVVETPNPAAVGTVNAVKAYTSQSRRVEMLIVPTMQTPKGWHS